MLDSGGKKLAFSIACLILVLGSASLIALHSNMPLASGLFTLAFLANAAVISTLSFRRMFQSPHLKTQWALFSTAAAWSIVVAIVALVVQPMPLIANHTTFFIFCGYLPPFLLISLPAGRRYFHQFIWIDLAQSVFALYVGYSIIYHARPFTHDVPTPISGAALFHLFLAGDFLILAGAFLHVLSAVNKDEMRFFRLFFLLYLLGTAGAYFHNVLVLRNSQETLSGLPVLAAGFLSILLIILSPRESTSAMPAQTKGLLGDLINIASPAIPSAVLFTLGAVVDNNYPALARAAILTAFALFVARSTFYQRSFETLQRDLQHVQRRLEELSYTDALTSLANRRAVEKALHSEWKHSARSGSSLSFLLIDVDFFKTINDEYGHQAGDEYLVAIARTLKTTLQRSIDVVGRYGGDEFAIILPSTDGAAAEKVAENICNAVHQLRMQNRSTTTGFATLSIGIATSVTFSEPTPDLLLGAADAALYGAKDSGRNCWRSYRSEPGAKQEPNSLAPPAKA